MRVGRVRSPNPIIKAARVVLVCLVLGAISSVVSAWWGWISGENIVLYQGWCFYSLKPVQTGASAFEVKYWKRSGGQLFQVQYTDRLNERYTMGSYTLNAWPEDYVLDHLSAEFSAEDRTTRWIEGRGWPWISMWRAWEGNDESAMPPVRFVWPGFAWNTFLWGAVAAAAWLLTRHLLGIRRAWLAAMPHSGHRSKGPAPSSL